MAGPGEAVVVRLPERFEAFYEREYHRVVGFAYAVAGSWEAAEDATQEAFLRAHRQWERVGRYDQPGAWVRRVAATWPFPPSGAGWPRAAPWSAWPPAASPTRRCGRRSWTSGGRCGPCPAASVRPWPCSTWRTGRPPRSPGSSAALRPRSVAISTGDGPPWPSA
jgi:hypothetical protein